MRSCAAEGPYRRPLAGGLALTDPVPSADHADHGARHWELGISPAEYRERFAARQGAAAR
jgi:hypothetical protein